MKLRGYSVWLVVVAFSMTSEAATTFTAREIVNAVFVSESLVATARPLADQDQVVAPSVVRTKADSRLELTWGERGLVRLGGETALAFEKDQPAAELIHGTALYDDLPPGYQLTVKFPDQPASISGGTGFAALVAGDQGEQMAVVFGSLAGKVRVNIGGQTVKLSPGDYVEVPVKGAHSLGCFNLPKQVASSLLLTGFQAPLPHLKQLEHETARFRALEKRGFIAPA